MTVRSHSPDNQRRNSPIWQIGQADHRRPLVCLLISTFFWPLICIQSFVNRLCQTRPRLDNVMHGTKSKTCFLNRINISPSSDRWLWRAYPTEVNAILQSLTIEIISARSDRATTV